ncbi:MAG TPA: hypothetical protein VGX23_18025 [Actinocrinis sp.]|nr:hypothetical protein [Actinocrinis sp.]
MSLRLEWAKHPLERLGLLLADEPDLAQRLIDTCLSLAADPQQPTSGATGVAGLLAITDGDWCVIYAVDARADTVRILRIDRIAP